TLQDLRERLHRIRWSDLIVNDGWSLGADQEFLRELAGYWMDRFDWRRQEADLNRLTHFRADVGGVKIHFIHERGKGPHSLPIVLTYGYPDSFARFSKLIPL